MKKLFFATGTCLFLLLSVNKTQSQVTSKPISKSFKPPLLTLKKPASKISADLNILYENRLSKNKPQTGGKPSLPNSSGLMERYIQVKGDKVLLDITVKENDDNTRTALQKIGFVTKAAFGRIFSGSLPITAIPQLEEITEIKFARPAYKPLHSSGISSRTNFTTRSVVDSNVTPVVSQGDTSLRSYMARTKYKVNGKGVKVGLLSDSYDDLGTASIGVADGELPGVGNPFGFTTPVKVLQEIDFGGIDEGRGMAEIVHDVAPGAAIDFYSAFFGQADFAQGILDLADDSCKVIADDIYYYREPFFQDGVIAQAVDQVKSQGVTYFSSAGNSSNESYESKYRPSSYSPLGSLYGTAHNFAAPGNTPVYLQPIKIPVGGYTIFNFQWEDPTFSAGGAGAETDLDIYILDADSNIVAFSYEDNLASGDPQELFDFYNTTSGTSFYVLILKYDGPDPGHLKYVYYPDFNDKFFVTTNPAIPGLRAATTFGHAKAAGAIATAATWYYQTPAYGINPPLVESFSSVGGVPNYFDKDGNKITPIVRKKPEVTAPDGGNTSFFPPAIYFGNQDIPQDADSYPNFFGTSAAAPHAAGVAALMIEAQKPKIFTPDQIKGILTSTAIDMNNIRTPGFDSGFDYNTGYGLIQADKAVEASASPVVAVKDLKVEAICSNNPAVTRRWKITNPNNDSINVHWFILGYGQDGYFDVGPGEKTFSTATVYYKDLPVPNVLVIDWLDNLDSLHDAFAFSTTAQCGVDSVSAKNSDQQLSARVAVKPFDRPLTAGVYPNPSTKNFRLYLSLSGAQKADVALYTVDGRLLHKQSGVANGVTDIDASDYKPGFYILKVKQGQQNKTFKLIKR